MERSRSKGLSLKKNLSWTLLGNIIYVATQWGMITAIAKLGSVKMVGQFSLGLAITAPIIFFANMKLRTVQVTDFNNEYNFKEFLSLRIITSLFALLITLLTVLLLGYSLETSILIILIGMSKCIESIGDIVYGVLHKNEKMDLIGKSQILKGVLTLICFVIILYFTNNLIYAVLAMCIVWIITLVFLDFKKAAHFLEKTTVIKSNNIRKILILSFPLGLLQMLVSLNTNIPRFILERYSSLEMVGYFSALSYILVAGNTVINALAQSVMPKLSKYYSKDNISSFTKLLRNLIVLGTLLGAFGVLVCLLFAKKILNLFYTEEYGIYSDVLILLMVVATFNYIGWFIECGLNAAKLFAFQAYIALLGLAMTAICSLIIIPKYGILGATITLLITSFVQSASKYILFTSSFSKHRKSLMD